MCVCKVDSGAKTEAPGGSPEGYVVLWMAPWQPSNEKS